MQKYEHAFGKNDIRGIYTKDITEELFYNIAFGYVNWLINQTPKPGAFPHNSHRTAGAQPLPQRHGYRRGSAL